VAVAVPPRLELPPGDPERARDIPRPGAASLGGSRTGAESLQGWSAYPPILSVKADMTVRRLGANRRPEQVQHCA
jgi:hypothetical protein